MERHRVFAAALARRADEATSKTGRERIVRAAVDEVADYLGNTPAVARRAYIDPRVIDRFRAGVTIDAVSYWGPTSDRVRAALIDLIAD